MLTKYVICSGQASMPSASREELLKFSFMALDPEASGYMTRQELIRLLKATHMAASEAEVARRADTIMAQGPGGPEGCLTFDEFVRVSKKFPNILFPRPTGA
jgi:serine/threonine-protein phosphatase 2B regulatory subunit